MRGTYQPNPPRIVFHDPFGTARERPSIVRFSVTKEQVHLSGGRDAYGFPIPARTIGIQPGRYAREIEKIRYLADDVVEIFVSDMGSEAFDLEVRVD